MPGQSDGDPISTGLIELDSILAGGYASNRIHLIEGQPGCGKTTLALQFLLAGKARGLRTLYISPLKALSNDIRATIRRESFLERRHP